VLAFHAGDRLLADVLPPGVAGFAIRGEEGDGGSGETTDLLPGEETALGQVCAIRRCQFAAGRRCGRRALAALDRAPEAILVGPGGEPRWPVGVIGSITHCCGYAAAIAMTAGVPAGIGIDVEPHQPISSRMLAHVASPSEHGWIAGAYDLGVHFDRLLFSVKESIYKAWFPLTSSRLRFADVRVTFQPADRCWRARLMVPGPTVHGEAILGFEGRYAVDDGFVLSFAASKTYVEKRTSRGIVSWVRKPTSGFEHNGGCDG
jgi:4'-phosphopantetheinyl transferase EntD